VSEFILWCPSIRGGDVVGDQGEGGRRSSIPERGGVRWSFDFGARRMGERVVVDVIGRIRLIWVFVEC